MSYSFRLPEEDPICECRYDEVHDRMDREDCPFHCDMVDDPEPAREFSVERKPPAMIAGSRHTIAGCVRITSPVPAQDPAPRLSVKLTRKVLS